LGTISTGIGALGSLALGSSIRFRSILLYFDVTFYFILVVHSERLLNNDRIYLIGETHIPSRSKDLNI
jgi:hypothetical protein